MTADSRSLHTSFLLEKFTEFYEELLRCVTETSRAPLLSAPVNGAPAAAIPEQPLIGRGDVASVNSFLLRKLESQSAEARALGGEFGMSYYRQAQYAMAALADEVFIHRDWEGRSAWMDNMLEAQLFTTYHAGEVLFDRIEDTLRKGDVNQREMAALYLQVLSLGFRGKYRDMDDNGRIDHYRRQLYRMVFQEEMGLQMAHRRLFEDAYAHNIEPGVKKKVPYLRWWLVALIVLIVVFAFSTLAVWEYLTHDIQSIVDKILQEFRY